MVLGVWLTLSAGIEMYAWCYNKAGELVKSNENMDLCLWNDKGYLEGGNE